MGKMFCRTFEMQILIPTVGYFPEIRPNQSKTSTVITSCSAYGRNLPLECAVISEIEYIYLR